MDGKALNEVSGPDAPLSLSIMKQELIMKEVCIVSMDMRTRFFSSWLITVLMLSGFV